MSGWISRLRAASRQRTRPRQGAQGGFTLLELIIVIAIIGILAAIAMPALKDMPRRANESVLKTNLHTIRDLIDQYYGDQGHYPESLDVLVDKGYVRLVPIDPMTKSATTWTLVFEEPDPLLEPAETDIPEGGGPGVIDVHSGSPQISLDGTAYAEW